MPVDNPSSSQQRLLPSLELPYTKEFSRSAVGRTKPPVRSDTIQAARDIGVDRQTSSKGFGTAERLRSLRKLMEKDNLDYYVVPSEDAHGSQDVAPSDRRREFISGYTAPVGVAIVARTTAYVVTDSRYWEQARGEVDSNWTLILSAAPNEAKDWVEWLSSYANNSRIGIDARMISSEQAIYLKSVLWKVNSKLVHPPQNLVDLVWYSEGGRPSNSRDAVYLQPIGYTGAQVAQKIAQVQAWLQEQSRGAPSDKNKVTGTLITALHQITYLLNLRNSERPDERLFHAYLFIGLERVVLFIDERRISSDVARCLESMGVERRDYSQLWPFLRSREFGNGKVLISPQTSYAVSLMLTPARYVVSQSSKVEEMMKTDEDMHNQTSTLVPPTPPTPLGSLHPEEEPTPIHVARAVENVYAITPRSRSRDTTLPPSAPPDTSRLNTNIGTSRPTVRQRWAGESSPPMFMPGLPSLESLESFSRLSLTSTPDPDTPLRSETSSIRTVSQFGMDSPALSSSYRGYAESLTGSSEYDY